MNIPKVKSADIVEQILGKEILIYDLSVNKAYHLNETSSVVYRAGDGETSFAELKKEHDLTDEIIHLALSELQKNDLLAADYVSPFEGTSRRELIRRIGLASVVSLPLVSALIAPAAINASSTCVNTGGISPGGNVGSNRFTSIGTVCGDPSLADNGCNFTYAGQCCSNRAVGRSCIQDVSPSTGAPRLAVYNCKCA